MPKSQEIAIIKPCLKKFILELIIRNYQLVSYFPLLSKLIERFVATSLIQH